MKVLIVDDESSTRDLIALLLGKAYSPQIVTAASGNEALRILKAGENFDAIFSDYHMADGTGGDLFNGYQKLALKTPFVLCSSEPIEKLAEFKDTEISGYVNKSEIKQNLLKVFSSLFFLKSRLEKEIVKFVPVQVDTLLRLNEMVCDVFVKLSEEKFVRVFKSGSSINLDAAQRYRAKGIHHLFIDSNSVDLMIFTLLESIESVSDLDRTADLTTNLLKIIDKIPDEQLKKELNHLNTHLNDTKAADAEYEKSVRASELVHKAIQHSIQKIGTSREVEQLIKATVKLSIDTIANTPELQAYYTALSQNPGDYINSHSVLLAHYSCLIADKMGWNSDLTRYKLSLASMLHDITLTSEKLAKVKSALEVEGSKDLSPADKTIILNHASEAAEIVKSLHHIPPDVDRLVEEHHCWAEGGGFPFQKSEGEMSPLTAVLIFAHELTDWIFENKGSPYAYQNFFIKNRRKFSQGIFKKIFTSITGHSPEVRNLSARQRVS